MSSRPKRLTLAAAAPAALALAFAAALLVGDADGQNQDILRPEQAFPYTLDADAGRLRLRFEVPEGYYLYRERFGFASRTPGVDVSPARFPAGEIHSDEFFGEQEIFRGDFEIAVPYRRTGADRAMELELKLQGCADIGLCYPPQTWTRAVDLPPAAAAGPLTSLIGGGRGDGMLPADEAFVMNARFDAANELTVSWQIEPGYYLYRDKLTFEAGGIGLGAARLPEGEPHYDDNFGDVTVFYDYVEARIPFSRASPDEAPVTITAGFQGCKEDSICYPPGEQTMSVVLPASSEFADSGAAAAEADDGMVSEQDLLADLVSNGALAAVLGTFFVAGLGLSLTPCVYPMIPILSSIIAGQGGQVSHGRSFALSVSYVLGMAVTYSAAGAITALAGNQVQAVFQQPWIIASAAGLFVVMALAMFGLFEIQVPAALQTRISGLANRRQNGTFAGTAIVGALSALIVTTCVAPPLIAALIAIGQSGDVARGSLALFVLAIGMGVPLLLIGASAGKVLPKVGPWMNTIKAGFGVVMVGMAIWMLDRILDPEVTLLLWALLVFMTGVFLGAFEPLPEHPRPAKRLSKGLGVLACLYGAMMLIGATLGGEDPLKPLPRALLAAGGAVGAPAEALDFEPIESVAELEAALAAARGAGRPVMVDFTADWCVSCKEMEAYTFPDAAVVAALEPFALLRADVTANDADDQALLGYFDSFGPPTIAFFDRSGTERNGYKLVGYVPAAEFAAHVERLASL